MARVLIVLTSHDQLGDTGKPTGFYLSEASHPWSVFKEAGFAMDFASPEGGKPPVTGLELDDPLNQAFLEDPEVEKKLENTLRADRVDPAGYDAIFYAGGHGTMWDFPNNRDLARVAAAIYEGGGVVGAVCHGPAALVNLQLSNGTYLVAGKQVSAFTNEEETAVGLTGVVPFMLESKLIERGAQIVKVGNFEPRVAVSERLVTGQNPQSAKGVGEAMVRLLVPVSTADV